VAGGRPLEQAIERLAFVGVQAPEDVVLGGGQGRLGLGQSADSPVGELDEVAAAVVGRPPPGDEAVGLELVEQADEVRPIDVERARERLLRAVAVIAEQGQGDEVARTEAERRQRGLRAEPGQPGEVVEQGRRPVRSRRGASPVR
jgi:hypothetical protein